MEKQVKVQLTVSYDKIRQVMCVMSGKVLQDSELEELIGNEIVNIESNIFGESEEGFSHQNSPLLMSIF